MTFRGTVSVSLSVLCLIAALETRAAAATVATQWPDYAPGDVVLMYGAGWEPGEVVALSLDEYPELCPNRSFTAVADADGNIVLQDFVVDAHDIGVTFTLTATGLTSGQVASTTFTDACPGGFQADPACPPTDLSSCIVGCSQIVNGQCHPDNKSAPAPNGSVCRSAAGACDTAETCNGIDGSCPADGFAASGTVCRTSAGVCDIAESCTGSSASCPADAVQPSGTACRASGGVCDVAENCDGSSVDCPADAVQPSGTVCRASGGVCDVAENCDGSSVDCPPDAVQPSGTVCRSSGGVCDVAENCDGSSVDCPPDAVQPSGTVCRASAGVCDVAESCDGSSVDCQADGYQPSGTLCRSSAGACDVAENCTGSAATCPADVVQPSGTVCRSSAGVCDVAESCNGSSVDCQADGYQPSGTLCRSSAGACDVAENCTGSAATCPADVVQPSGTVCRSSAGVCDVAESCNGSSVDCQADGYQPSGTLCRSSAGACDVAENCTGSAATCPADVVQPSGTVCRSSAGACDVVESCNGSAVTCPSNGVKPSGTVCRSSAGVCDVAETCSGYATGCPADVFKPSSTICRSKAGECDIAEHCTGGAAACPSDVVSPDGTPCTDDQNPCTADECDGSHAACQHPQDTCSLVTSSSLCTFDVDSALTGGQFRIVLTPDQNSQTAWKLNATNPGQFYYNVIYLGPGSTTLDLIIPYPFVTQGAMPVHVYGDVATSINSGSTCFAPGTEIGHQDTQITLATYSPAQLGSTTTVSVTLPALPNGVAYVNIHLDYGLKGTSNYSKNASNDAIDATTLAIRLPDKETYVFADSIPGGDVAQSENVFKRDPGIAGLVRQVGTDEPVADVKVQIYDSSNKLVATVYSDQDGWYMWQFKYTGKASTFTVKLPAYGLAQSVTLKSNGFVTANFTLP